MFHADETTEALKFDEDRICAQGTYLQTGVHPPEHQEGFIVVPPSFVFSFTSSPLPRTFPHETCLR